MNKSKRILIIDDNQDFTRSLSCFQQFLKKGQKVEKMVQNQRIFD